MKIFVAHASSFDFRKKLYEPIRASALNSEHEFILPEEPGDIWNTKEVIESCGAFVAEVSVPSTGAGIEIGWANAAGVPIIAVHEKGSAPSAVIPYVSKMTFEYDSSAGLIEKIGNALASLK